MAELEELGRQMLADSRAWFGEGVPSGSWSEVLHFALGLGGEAGEVLDVVKKGDVCRAIEGSAFVEECGLHADGKHSAGELASELADVLTYLLLLAEVLDVDLERAYFEKRAANVERWGEP